jgi:hypothetical protein
MTSQFYIQNVHPIGFFYLTIFINPQHQCKFNYLPLHRRSFLRAVAHPPTSIHSPFAIQNYLLIKFIYVTLLDSSQSSNIPKFTQFTVPLYFLILHSCSPQDLHIYPSIFQSVHSSLKHPPLALPGWLLWVPSKRTSLLRRFCTPSPTVQGSCGQSYFSCIPFSPILILLCLIIGLFSVSLPVVLEQCKDRKHSWAILQYVNAGFTT